MALYNLQMPERAYRLALLGLTDAEIAAALDCSVSTLRKWYEAHPDFCQAVRDGRTEADAKVAASLYKKATVDGDVSAQKYWLTNRSKRYENRWSDRQTIEGDKDNPVRIDGSEMSDEEFIKHFKFALRELAEREEALSDGDQTN